MDNNTSTAFELTKPLTEAYQDQVLPYEIVVESIGLQNK